MLQAVGLEALSERAARELSGGEVQRTAIARALVHQPRLVLADEPTGNLDPRNAAQTLKLLRDQIKRNAGAGILITHSRAAAETADRILLLDAQGRPGIRSSAHDFGGCCSSRSCANSRVVAMHHGLGRIALGVALGTAVYLVNSAALNEFGLATKRLVGESDVIVRGPREGFSEQLFAQLARNPQVSIASPVLELDVALAGRGETLKVLALDPFRAAALQPTLLADIGEGVFPLLASNGIYLSDSAAQRLGLKRDDLLQVTVGSSPRPLRVLGILSSGAYSQELALMDIATAQWLFDRVGQVEPHCDSAFKGRHRGRVVSGANYRPACPPASRRLRRSWSAIGPFR